VGDLGAIHEDVRFNWAAAADLAAELRLSAAVLEEQVPQRRHLAALPRAEWRGRYAEAFDRRIGVCVGDAGRFATSMRSAADDLDELGRLAREEQARREQAREWQRKQDAESWLERNILDPVFGEDDLPPPQPAVEAPRIAIAAPGGGARD
jgi:hypothetical protein